MIVVIVCLGAVALVIVALVIMAVVSVVVVSMAEHEFTIDLRSVGVDDLDVMQQPVECLRLA